MDAIANEQKTAEGIGGFGTALIVGMMVSDDRKEAVQKSQNPSLSVATNSENARIASDSFSLGVIAAVRAIQKLKAN